MNVTCRIAAWGVWGGAGTGPGKGRVGCSRHTPGALTTATLALPAALPATCNAP